MTEPKRDEAASPNGSGLSDLLGLGAMLPACWALTQTLDARETMTRGYLWFTNPKNTSWEPLAAALRELGEIPVMKGEFTSDAEYEHHISDKGFYGTRMVSATTPGLKERG